MLKAPHTYYPQPCECLNGSYIYHWFLRLIKQFFFSQICIHVSMGQIVNTCLQCLHCPNIKADLNFDPMRVNFRVSYWVRDSFTNWWQVPEFMKMYWSSTAEGCIHVEHRERRNTNLHVRLYLYVSRNEQIWPTSGCLFFGSYI